MTGGSSRGIHEEGLRGVIWPAELLYPPASGYAPYGNLTRAGADHRDDDRFFMARAVGEVRPWFGGRDAQRRREYDYRGKGPKNYALSDERIREDINERLTEDVWLHALEIDLKFVEVEITFAGTIENRRTKRRPQDITDDASCAKHFQNNLRYTSHVVKLK